MTWKTARTRLSPLPCVLLLGLAISACSESGGGGQPANRPPTLSAIASATIEEGESHSIGIVANDPDGDPIVLSLSAAPSFATVSGSTVDLTPDYADAGVHSVTVRASDATDTVEETFALTVLNVNRPPVVEAVSAQRMLAGGTLDVTLAATDPDGESVAFSLTSAPAYANLIGDTIGFEPGAEVLETVAIQVVASDGDLETAIDFDLTVTDQSSASFTAAGGGSLTTPVGSAVGARLEASGGVLATDQTITLQNGTDVSAACWSLVGPPVLFTPASYDFVTPASITLPYREIDAPDAAAVRILRRDDANDVTTLATPSPLPADGLATTTTPGLGTFQAATPSNPTISPSVSSPGLCPGLSATFACSSSGAGAVSWRRDVGTTPVAVSSGPDFGVDPNGALTINASLPLDGVVLDCVDEAGCPSEPMTLRVNASPAAAACTPVTLNTGNFGTGIVRFRMSDSEGTPLIDHSHDDFANDGTQDRVCTAWAVVTPGESYSLQIDGYETLGFGGNSEYARAYVDFNDDGSFSAGEMILNDNTTRSAVHTATLVIPSVPAKRGTMLRIRILTDYGLLTSGCANVNYGEVEDYGLFIR